MTFKAATCPSCGGALQVPDDRDSVKCMYCGVSVIVREAIQAANIGNTHNWLRLANVATQAGNFQEAYNFYNKVLEVNTENHEAWFGKAKVSGYLSSPWAFRLPEMIIAFKTAIQCAAPEYKNAVIKGSAEAINDIIARLFRTTHAHVNNVLADDNAWASYLQQCWVMIEALELAHNYSPHSSDIIQGEFNL